VLWLLGLPLLSGTWDSLRKGILSTDALLSLGVAASFAVSFLSVLRGEGPIYFEVGCVILVMTTLGRWLEATGRLKATSALDALEKLLPATVRRLAWDEDEEIALECVVPGDLLRVRPGERFPADGRVAGNTALVDEQVLTGESRPVLKEPGARILGGMLNLDGELIVEVTAVGARGTLARLVELVKDARASKGRYQRLVDRISSWFFPVVAAVAVLAFLYHAATTSLDRGLLAGLAVSLIACPCALGLATPLAVWSAIGQAAGQQVLFRGGEALERLAEVGAVRFDKTGTLTTGTAEVQECVVEHAGEADLVRTRAATLASSSPHALSRAIAGLSGGGPSRSRPTPGSVGTGRSLLHGEQIEELRVVPGRGVTGRLGTSGPWVSLGSPRLMDERGLQLGPLLRRALDDALARGLSVALVGWEDSARGLFVFQEAWRPGHRSVLAWLERNGLDVGILTGDHRSRGQAIALELGVSVDAELLPDQKVDAIRRARARFRSVAMVGDGVNDAPALAASDVGIALGCGTDVSRDSASVCLLGDDLSRIPWTIELSRRAVRVIRRNLFWAFAYNTAGVVVAALGWLNPALAALLMVASSAVVIGNSLRLRQPFETPTEAINEGQSAPTSPAPRAVARSEALVLGSPPR
jgi:heavy metal translocating P-type ATPase